MSQPPFPNTASAEMKRALIEAGFEVFRVRGEEITLAERPRENLIMDSGVRLRVSEPLEVHVVFRAQKADFPNEDESHLFDRVRLLAEAALPAGFSEKGVAVTRIEDPGDAERTLDVFYEITYAKTVGGLAEALPDLRLAMTIEKRVSSDR
jgi:hypothetical protein